MSAQGSSELLLQVGTVMKRAMAIKKIEARKMLYTGQRYKLQTEVFDKLTRKSPKQSHLAVMKAALQKINKPSDSRVVARDFGFMEQSREVPRANTTEMHKVLSSGLRTPNKAARLTHLVTEAHSESLLDSPLAVDSGQKKLEVLCRLAQKRNTPKDQQKKQGMLFSRQNWVQPSKSLPAKTPNHNQQSSVARLNGFEDVLMIETSLHQLQREYGSYIRTIKKSIDIKSVNRTQEEKEEITEGRRLWQEIGRLKQVVHNRLQRQKCSLIGIVGQKKGFSQSQHLTPQKHFAPLPKQPKERKLFGQRKLPQRYKSVNRSESRNITLSSWEHTDSFNASEHKLP